MKFSVQEMTDCYFKGCDGGDYRMVTRMMSYIDKLGSESNYGRYMDGQFTCRQATTPDNLDKIKITDYVPVTANTVEVIHSTTYLIWVGMSFNICLSSSFFEWGYGLQPCWIGQERPVLKTTEG